MPYCVKADLEVVFGTSNLTSWADADNSGDTVAIDARIEKACEVATDYINGRLMQSAYAIPFEETYPALLVDLTARKAGVWLYRLPRGIRDGDPDESMAALNDEVEQQLDAIIARKLFFPGVARVTSPGPFAVIDNTTGVPTE